MELDLNELKRQLHRRIPDMDAYRSTEVLFSAVLRRAAQIAVQCVDDVAVRSAEPSEMTTNAA